MALAIAVLFGNVLTAAVVRCTWPVAYAAVIKRANAVVHIITHPVVVRIVRAVATANTQRIRHANTIILRIAKAVSIYISLTIAPAYA